jgi:hypothetical protein
MRVVLAAYGCFIHRKWPGGHKSREQQRRKRATVNTAEFGDFSTGEIVNSTSIFLASDSKIESGDAGPGWRLRKAGDYK